MRDETGNLAKKFVGVQGLLNDLPNENDTSSIIREEIYELKNYYHDLMSFEKGVPFKRDKPKIGRNQLCPCNSLKKFKHCCGNK